MIQLVKGVSNIAVMERDLFYNVTMVTIKMVMAVQEIVKFNLGIVVQEVVLIVKITVICTDQTK